MLVLSRRLGQRIHFPTLGVTVEVLQARGNTVRLGIQAPPDVHVLREELLPTAAGVPRPDRDRGHEARGRVNTAVMAIHLAQKQLQAGLTADAGATLETALQALEAFDPFLAAPAAGRPIDALLVEDDHNEEALLASYLRLAGFRIEAVRDGREALDFLARNRRPDCVLLDMHLPRCDGAATLTAIRDNPAFAGLRVYAVSGSAPEECGVAVGPHGLDGWFRKPLNPARLVESLRAALGSSN